MVFAEKRPVGGTAPAASSSDSQYTGSSYMQQHQPVPQFDPMSSEYCICIIYYI